MAEWPAAAGEAERQADPLTAAPGFRGRAASASVCPAHALFAPTGLIVDLGRGKMAVIAPPLTNTAMAEGKGEGGRAALCVFEREVR